MKQFEIGVFKDVVTKNPKLVKELWAILTTSKNIIRMQAASDLKKPAVLVIWQELLEKYKPVIFEDRVKQMIGNMIRQILEDNGYKHDRYNIPISSQNPLFSYGSRYEKC